MIPLLRYKENEFLCICIVGIQIKGWLLWIRMVGVINIGLFAVAWSCRFGVLSE
jgi:hypothetical protein